MSYHRPFAYEESLETTSIRPVALPALRGSDSTLQQHLAILPTSTLYAFVTVSHNMFEIRKKKNMNALD